MAPPDRRTVRGHHAASPGEQEDREIRLQVRDISSGYASAFWDGSTYGVKDLEDATTISVGSGESIAGKDLTLRAAGASTPETIENTAPPVVAGAAVVGQQLTATTGAWSVADAGVALQCAAAAPTSPARQSPRTR